MTNEPRQSGPPPFPNQRSDQQREQIRARTVEWLDKRWPLPRACPIDGNTNWAIGDVIEAPLDQGGSVIVGGPTYLFVPVSCTTCGHTYLFNAIQIGVFEPDAS
jgi:hypothetical protein